MLLVGPHSGQLNHCKNIWERGIFQFRENLLEILKLGKSEFGILIFGKLNLES